MEKRYKRLNMRTRHSEDKYNLYASGFVFRTLVCLLLFLMLAGIRFYGQELYLRVQNQIAACLTGEKDLVGAYTQSVEAVNLFCDHIVEAQND